VGSTRSARKPGTGITGWARWLLFALVAIGMAWAWASGRLAAIDIDGLRALVAASGAWGPLVFVLTFALLQPVGVTAHLFVVAAGVLWPVPQALVWAQVGLLLGAMVSYGVGQALAPEVLISRLPARVRSWEVRLREGGLWTVVAVRVVFFTFFAVSALMGAVRVPMRHYVLGTFIGCLPVLVGEVVLAHELVDRFSTAM